MKTLQFITLALLLLVPLLTVGQQRKLTVTIDERIELLTTVQLLSNYHWLTKADLDYKKDVYTVFDKFKNHQAVLFYKSISDRFYGYNPILLMCHYELPGFEKVGVFNPEDSIALNYKINKDTLDTFVRLLKDFYTTTDFHAFFIAHQQYYDSIAEPIVTEANRMDYTGIIENHYGQKNAAYKIVLSPLQMDAGFGPMIQSNNGNILYAIVGPDYNSGLLPIFDKDVIFQELVIHEFSHSFCNPLIDEFYNDLQQDSCLLKPIIKAQKEQGYGDWKTCLYEHFTRANEIILINLMYDKETAEDAYKKQVELEKWIYLKGLVPLLRDEYIKNRKKYKTLQKLMPKIVEYFNMEKKNCQ